MALLPDQRDQIVTSLRSILEPTRVARGCLACRLYFSVENVNRIAYVEEWQTQADLQARMRAGSFRILLASLDMATEPPEVRFETISKSSGLEMLVDGADFEEAE